MAWSESEEPGWVLVLGKITGKGRLQVYPALTRNNIVCGRLIRAVALKPKTIKSKAPSS
jgi:hypothetical protein